MASEVKRSLQQTVNSPKEPLRALELNKARFARVLVTCFHLTRRNGAEVEQMEKAGYGLLRERSSKLENGRVNGYPWPWNHWKLDQSSMLRNDPALLPGQREEIQALPLLASVI